jgi:hypothetical protein
MEFRASALRGVTFVDCDVGRLSFSGLLLRSVELLDCTFVDCAGPHHVRYRGIRFSGCHWNGGVLSGSISSSTLQGCEIASAEIDDLVLANSTLADFKMTDVQGQGLTIRESAIRGAMFGGQLTHVNLVDLALHDVDLSSLHVVDGGLLGIEGDATMPNFPDSFVVMGQDIANLKPILAGQVRRVAVPTLERVITDGFALEWFDRRRLDSSPADTPRLLPEEQSLILRLLWEHRAESVSA